MVVYITFYETLASTNGGKSLWQYLNHFDTWFNVFFFSVQILFYWWHYLIRLQYREPVNTRLGSNSYQFCSDRPLNGIWDMLYYFVTHLDLFEPHLHFISKTSVAKIEHIVSVILVVCGHETYYDKLQQFDGHLIQTSLVWEHDDVLNYPHPQWARCN